MQRSNVRVLPSNRVQRYHDQGDCTDRKGRCDVRPIALPNRSACAHAMRLFDDISPLCQRHGTSPTPGIKAKDTVPANRMPTWHAQRAVHRAGKNPRRRSRSCLNIREMGHGAGCPVGVTLKYNAGEGVGTFRLEIKAHASRTPMRFIIRSNS